MSTIGSTTKEDNTDGGAGPTADNAPLIVPDDCLSHLFFSWATPLVIKGYSTPLVPDDVPWLHQGYDPQDLTESALRTYESLRQEEAAAEEAAAACGQAKQEVGKRTPDVLNSDFQVRMVKNTISFLPIAGDNIIFVFPK